MAPFVFFVVSLVFLFALFVKWRQNYWQRKGVPVPPYDYFYGHIKKLFRGKVSFGENSVRIYKDLRRMGVKHGGNYFFWNPIYFPVDPSLIKQIIVKDFDYFTGHGIYHHPNDPMTINLFNLEGDSWKKLRSKLTPVFTSGKMKMMFETLVEKATGLDSLVGDIVDKNEALNIKEILGRFTTDIFGSVAFGIECNSMEEGDNVFRKYGKRIITPNVLDFVLRLILPWSLVGNLGFKQLAKDVESFFTNLVLDTIKTRQMNETMRKDFMHLLIEMKNKNILNDTEIIAQCIIFFLAGFETSSSTMTFTLLELAQNLDIQQRLRDEINRVVEVTYDTVMGMEYLDKVINEALRKNPPVPILPRVCTKTYRVPGTDVVIEKGTRVTIPIWGVQTDPEYYPNPDKFDPERFNAEEKAKRPDMTYLPFGDGPRMCIGLRFGVMQSKLGLVTLLRKYKFTLNEKTKTPIEMDIGVPINTVKGDVWLNASKI